MNLRPERADPRRIAAILANPDLRIAYAEIVLAQTGSPAASRLSPARRKKALESLLRSTLIEHSDNGELVATDQAFREILARYPTPTVATGVDRFLRDGKIDRYPSAATERYELLSWIARQTLRVGEVVSEKDLNARLIGFSDDYAVLRRYLVDFSLLERTNSGSSYSRVAADDE